MSYDNLNLIDTVEQYLGISLPEEELQILSKCKKTLSFTRKMDVNKTVNARLTSSVGQLLMSIDNDGNFKSVHRVRTVGNQHRDVVQPVKTDDTTMLVVVTNLDYTKKTGSGVWIWDYSNKE